MPQRLKNSKKHKDQDSKFLQFVILCDLVSLWQKIQLFWIPSFFLTFQIQKDM